ncbi:efflux RND transporter permease subunit [Tautonia sp. JC769]|uniref:efflux RND transporter permease subunit n=1 Tax=Tautonia sp. JC769 TaxID=3232135 RepID=UPI00345A1668
MQRPFTVMVAVVAVALGSVFAVSRMPVDIFPNLNLPVVYVCQPYGGMDPAQMEGLLTNYYEYHFLYINGIHHVESKNVQGMAIMKLYFHPGTNMAQAMAETIGYVTRSRAFMPPGTVSPFITRFDAGSVPVGYLVLSSETRTVGDIQDQALFRVRPMFAALPGVSAPPPFGGSQRSVVIRLDPERLRSYAMSPDEVIRALTAGNVISPSGNIRIDDEMPIVPVNSLVKDIDELLAIPIRPGGDPTVYLRDVGTVEDSSDIAVGYALVDGRRAVYILVTKRAEASTLSVVQNVRDALPEMQAVLPDDIRVGFEFDQSPTVTNAIEAVGVEGLLGAGLIGVMVLIFLRDWRSAVVIVLNIPIAIAAALFALWVSGQTMNLMTLGGLALAIGVLVDESTVAIENIHVRMRTDPSLATAVKRGTAETAVPRFTAMLCILAVFIPSFLMEGAARALFVPMSLAVGFAMIASYVLSSTFVPVLTTWVIRDSRSEEDHHHPHRRTAFDRVAGAYERLVRGLTRVSPLVVVCYLIATGLVTFAVGRQLGLEIFPSVDAGRFQMRVKAPAGTRVEKTEEMIRDVLATIEDEVGRDAIEISVGYAGLIPSSYPINAIYQWTGGPEEAMLRVALKPGTGISIEDLKDTLRERLRTEMPSVAFSFEPADIVSDVMSFGSPTPVEVAISGPDFADVRAHAESIRAELEATSGLSDVRYGQTLDYPAVQVTIDREKAGLSGITPEEIARSLVTATWSSRFVVPNYWPDPKSGIGYQVQVEIPFQEMTSLEDLRTLPIRQDREGGVPLLLRDVARVERSTVPGQYDRYNMKRTLTLTANLAGIDLGRASGAVDRAIERAGDPPKGVNVAVRGQLVPLREILSGLAIGLGMSVIVIVLVLTANFQSIRLALVAVAAGPAVIAGVVLGLWITHTTVNIQSFMGTIMVFGVAVSNAILLVTFAERSRVIDGLSARDAAIAGARSRLRAILMTSSTMLVGMLPMASGLGEGGDQTAPLGRAVIGGLSLATLSTLLVLPSVFTLIQGRMGRDSPSLDPDDPESPHFVGVPAPHVGMASPAASAVEASRPPKTITDDRSATSPPDQTSAGPNRPTPQADPQSNPADGPGDVS